MTPIGWNHAEDNSIISTLVILFCALRRIPVKELTNCSFRKTTLQEAQPDIAFYIASLDNIPPRSNSPVDLNQFAPPALVVEMAASSVGDDLGEKRLLYERLAVQEYWVVDVNRAEVTAFAVADGGSRQIDTSQVLPGLTMALVRELWNAVVLKNMAQLLAGLLSQFS
jgi:Uma2 family endonuclease